MVDFDTARSLWSDGGDTVLDCSDDELTMMEGGKDAVRTSSSQDLRKEEIRLQTFRHWPEEWAMELARFGFSSLNDYMGTVRCVFCGGEVSGFSSPREAHLKHWQHARHYCPYLRGKDVGDVPHKANTQRAAPAPTGTSIERHYLHHHQTSATFPAEPHLRGNGSQARSARGLSQNVSSTQREPGTLSAPHTTTSKPSSKSRTTSSSGPKLGQEPEAKPQPVRSGGGVHWTEMVRTARYPSLAVYQQRLKTLRCWPLLKPSPAELARAGFFQEPGTSGSHPQCAEDSGDAVKCFWCGQRVHRWQRTDDALLEHARLSPGCLYVIQLLGQPLHDDVVNATTDVARGSQRNDVTRPAKWCDELAVHGEQLDRSLVTPGVNLSTERQPGGTSRPHPHHHHHHHHTPTPRLPSAQLDDLMQSSSVQTVLQMGFPRQLIRDLLSHNSERLTADTLCRLALQAAEEQTSSWVSSSSARPTPRPPPPPSKEASVLEEVIPREDDSSSLRFVHPGRIPEYSQDHKSQLNSQTPGYVDGRCREREGSVDCLPADGGGSEGGLLCKVCSEEEVKVVFRPCDHLVCCGKCGEWFGVCPVCQRDIEEVVPLVDLAS